MEKQRKYKLFSIIALMFAVVALSVGFAAFQKILNISSSAQVTLPSDENLKLTLYGLNNIEEFNQLYNGKKADYLKWSMEKSYTILNTNQPNYEYYATINNDNLSIDISNIEFNTTGKQFNFYFLLRNESDCDVYVYLSEENRNNLLFNGSDKYWDASCQAIGDTTTSLVDAACQNIKLQLVRFNSNRVYPTIYEASSVDGEFLNGDYKISPNKEIVFNLRVRYSGDAIADGTFSVNFDPIKIEFGSMPASYYNTAGVNEEI